MVYFKNVVISIIVSMYISDLELLYALESWLQTLCYKPADRCSLHLAC